MGSHRDSSSLATDYGPQPPPNHNVHISLNNVRTVIRQVNVAHTSVDYDALFVLVKQDHELKYRSIISAVNSLIISVDGQYMIPLSCIAYGTHRLVGLPIYDHEKQGGS